MTYTRDWGGAHPGCMIILLDQSGSMDEEFGLSYLGGKPKRKSDEVAKVLNGFLNDLVLFNTKFLPDGTPDVRPRADICILGYDDTTVEPALEGNLAGKLFVTLPELEQSPIRIEKRKVKETDDLGNIVEVEVPFLVWVKPKAGGGTPMCAALYRARDLAAQWAASHPDNYPPVIVNVTDGIATDGDDRAVMQAAEALTQVSTSDGQALLYNVHITNLNVPSVSYPADESALPSDQYARLLLAISSVIPEESRSRLEQMLPGQDVRPGARGMIFNGDAVSVRLMFNFASTPAMQPPANR